MRIWGGTGTGRGRATLARAMAGRRTPTPPDPLPALYGTGLGQIPLHLAPEDAVLAGNGNVTGIANRGGAGAAFNATASATGISKSGALLNVTEAAARLALAVPADLVGVRTFMVVALSPTADPFSRLLGHPSPANLVRVNASTGQLLAQRSGVNNFLTAPATPPGTTLRLWEVEFAAGRVKVWMNGVLAHDGAHTFADFQASLIFASGFDANGFTGTAGDIVSVITDGTPARDATMLTVRQSIAAEHGIPIVPQSAPVAAVVPVPAIPAGAWLTSFGKEQSLGLGANAGTSADPDGVTPARAWAYAINDGKARMLTGLRRADGVAQQNIGGPLLAGYDTAFPAKGEAILSTSAQVGNVPVQYLIMSELQKRGVFSNTFVTLFSNAGGQAIVQLDDNLPAVTGTAAKVLYDNLVFSSQQIAARAAANGASATMLFDVLIQGEADAGAAAGAWRAGYDEVDKDQRAALTANGYSIASVPKLIFQTGGYVNASALDHNVSLEQLDVVRAGGAIFAGPLSQFYVDDNTVHPNLAEYARIATLGAWAFQESLLGNPFNLLSSGHSVVGNTVLIQYPMRPGEQLRSINSKFDPYGGNPFGGFEVTGGAAILSVAPSTAINGALVVTLDRPAAGLGRLKLGRQKMNMTGFAANGRNYGSQRVGWAGTHTSPSLIWPGAVAERVLPSEEWII